MLTPPRLSKLKSIVNIRALQTSIYSNLQEEVLDNGFIVNEVILNSDARHIEKTMINFTILSILMMIIPIFIINKYVPFVVGVKK